MLRLSRHTLWQSCSSLASSTWLYNVASLEKLPQKVAISADVVDQGGSGDQDKEMGQHGEWLQSLNSSDDAVNMQWPKRVVLKNGEEQHRWWSVCGERNGTFLA
jgi:hypothetical protein